MAKTKPARPKTKKKPETKSRLFEELIARIESTLVPQGAIVKSPDFIPDRITGSLREVDASIRYQVGSTPILITIECRRRSRVDDATWLEQLATKQSDIGAAKTIAVSLKGFGKPAITKAAFYGIEIRRIEAITTEEIEDWKNKLVLMCWRVEYNSARVMTYLKVPVVPKAELEIEMAGGDPSKNFLFFKRSGSGWSMKSLLDTYERKYGPIAEALAKSACTNFFFRKGGKILRKEKLIKMGYAPDAPRTVEFTAKFPEGAYCITNYGNIDVDSALITATATDWKISIPLQKLSSYVSENRVISHVAEYVAKDGKEIEIEVIFVPGK
jgi:hypothetical protein